MPEKISTSLDVETAVRDRYSAASQAAEPALCCPVQYQPQYLEVLPQELIDRDYGCGDPSRYVKEGETVLDLGSGGGKICYIASQIVGPQGSVIGVDMNDEMLGLARQYQEEIAARVGWSNVRFHKAKIQDLAFDLDRWESHLQKTPVDSASTWLEALDTAQNWREESPLIPDDSIDVVLSNCVLNLVRPEDRLQLFAELHRVLRRGGRAVISDIVCDEPVPKHLQNNPELWSGCISGAFVEDAFLRAFEAAGFYGVEIVVRQEEPWAVIEGIEFRSLTVQAYKGKDGPCMDHHQAVIYKGPWKSVTDDDGHVLHRGVRTAVCEKTFQIYTRDPYGEQVVPVPPAKAVSSQQAQSFQCSPAQVRDPKQTKGAAAGSLTVLPVEDCCGPSGDCC